MKILEILFAFNVSFAVLFGLYFLFLRKLTFFRLNRFILLMIPLISLGISLIPDLIVQTTLIAESNFVGLLPEFRFSDGLETVPSLVDVLVAIYITGVGLFSLFFGYRLMLVFNTIRNAKLEKVDDYYIMRCDKDIPTFSFLNYVHIREEDNDDIVLRHELTHIRQKHSYDLLTYEVLKVLNWFNPLMFIAQSQLSIVHEFLADEHSVDKDTAGYCQRLIRNAQFNTEGLLFKFNSTNHLKSRIIMLTKSRSTKINTFKYLLFVPVIAFLAFTMDTNSGQQTAVNPIVKYNDSLYTKADVMPTFGNGKDDLMNFLIENFNYPKDAKEGKLEGRVVVSFVVDKDGKVTGTKIEQGVHQLLDNESLRIVNSMPNWNPGENDGKKVRVKMMLPIVFKLK